MDMDDGQHREMIQRHRKRYVTMVTEVQAV